MASRLGSVCLLMLMGVISACGQPAASQLDGFADGQRAYWDKTAPRCNGYPSKANCDDGDMALFSGLLCASGDARGCAQVRDAQGPDGQWWRSPRRNPGNLGEGHAFSRDMAMGVWLYLTTTHDVGAAQRWLGWINDNRPCITPKPWGNGCLIRGPQRFCRDESGQSCTLTPASWALMGRVWDALGLGRTSEMRTYQNADIDTLVVQAKEAPLGYQAHLTAVEVLLKQRLGSLADTRQQAARALADRQPENPFFAYLNGADPGALKGQALALCPQPGSGAGGGDQWAWERETSSQAWHDSMSWDCLFLANVLEGR